MNKFLIFCALCTAILYACVGERKDRAGGERAGNAGDAGTGIHHQAVIQRGIDKGNKIAALAQQALASKLKEALTDGGVEHAIQFCKLNAYPILDSVQEDTGADIRRVSFKTRNPEDKPDSVEAQILTEYTAKHVGGEAQPARAVLLEDGEMVLFAKPIVVDNALCLVCHGKPGEALTAETLEIIERHYPQDQATGYSQGDLRGMWSIRLPRQALLETED